MKRRHQQQRGAARDADETSTAISRVEQLRLTPTGAAMLSAAGLLADEDCRVVEAQDARTILVASTAAANGLFSGGSVVRAIEHFTQLPGQRNEASSASDFPTIAARRLNWAVVRSLCKERLSFEVPSQVGLNALAGDPEAVSWIIHNVGILVDGGAFGSRSHEQQALRAHTLLAPLQQQVAMMALLISQQQQQEEAAQRVQEVALFHRQQLLDCISEEMEQRARIEHAWRWDHSVFFPDLTALVDSWQSSRAMVERQEARRFVTIVMQHDEMLGPLAFDNFKRLGREAVRLQEQDERYAVASEEGEGWRTIVAAHNTWGDEAIARSTIAAAEDNNRLELLRRIFCYFETIIELDAVVIQENARREVLETYFSRDLAGMRVKAVRLIPQSLLSAKRMENAHREVDAAASRGTQSRAHSAKLDLLKSRIARDRRGTQWRGHLASDSSTSMDDGERTSTSAGRTHRSGNTRSLAGSTGTRDRIAVVGGRDGQPGRLAGGGVSAPVSAAFSHLLTGDEEAERRALIATPPDPPATPASDALSRPPSTLAADTERVKYHRAHLPHHGYKRVAVVQAYCRYRRAVLLGLRRFYAAHRDVFRWVQRRWAFRSLELPALLSDRDAAVQAMLADGAVYNRSVSRVVFKGSAKPTNTPAARLLVSALVKLVVSHCNRCCPIVQAVEAPLKQWIESEASGTEGDVGLHDREVAMLRWDALLCGNCSPHFLRVIGIDPVAEHRHALKRLLVASRHDGDASGDVPPDLKRTNDISQLTAAVEEGYPCLRPQTRGRAIQAILLQQALLRWRLAIEERDVRSLRQLRLRVVFSHRAVELVVRLQARWRILQWRRTLGPEYRPPCRCAVMFEMLQRRAVSTFEHFVPVEYSKRNSQRKVMRFQHVVRSYEPWILYHVSDTRQIPPADTLNVELLHVSDDCVRTRHAYQQLMEDWRLWRQFGVWVYQRLRFLVAKRRAQEAAQAEHCCGRPPNAASPGVLRLLTRRCRAFPGFAVSRDQRHVGNWERYRALINRNCAECSSTWSRLRSWCRDYCSLASFVRTRFAYVIRKRDLAAGERRSLLAHSSFPSEVAGLPPRRGINRFALAEDSSLCKSCGIVLSALRTHLTYTPALCESRVARYVPFVCRRCVGPLQTLVRPFVEHRRAALFFQARYRWRRAWRSSIGALARKFIVVATRGGCARCDAVLVFLRTRIAVLVGSGQSFRPKEAESYRHLMCRDRCLRVCDSLLSAAERETRDLQQHMEEALQTPAEAPPPQKAKQLWVERLAMHRTSLDSLLSSATVQAFLRWQQSIQVTAFMKRRAARGPKAHQRGNQRVARIPDSLAVQVGATEAHEEDFVRGAVTRLTQPSVPTPTAAASAKPGDAFLATATATAADTNTQTSGSSRVSPRTPYANNAPYRDSMSCRACRTVNRRTSEWCRSCGTWLLPQAKVKPAVVARVKERERRDARRRKAPTVPTALQHLLADEGAS